MSVRIRTISHWVGLVLAAPCVVAGGVGLLWWLRGDFPPTVTLFTFVLVLAMLLAGAALIYGVCRGIGWLLASAA